MQRQDAVSIRDVMSTDILTVEPEDTLREAAQRISERGAGSAIVVDPSTPESHPGIVTERDVIRSVGADQDPGNQHVADHFTSDAVAVPPGSQRTVTLPVPVREPEPIAHVHSTRPPASAMLGPNPSAWLMVPAGVR